MNETDTVLAKLIERMQEAGFAQAPEVIDGAVRAIFLDGVYQLGFMALFVCLLAFFIGAWIQGIKADKVIVQKFGYVGGAFSFCFFILWSVGNPLVKVLDPQAALYQEIVSGLF